MMLSVIESLSWLQNSENSEKWENMVDKVFVDPKKTFSVKKIK